MKVRVLEINRRDETVLIKLIDTNKEYKCSVCGTYKPISHFTDKKKLKEMQNIGYTGKQTRTNCTQCYNMPYEEMNNLKNKKNSRKMENDILKYSAILESEKKYNDIINNTISIQDLIDELSKLNPDDRITTYHKLNSYYDIDYCIPEIETIAKKEKKIYSIS